MVRLVDCPAQDMTNTTQETNDMTRNQLSREDAYRKGWDASKRTKTYDLDLATNRFVWRWGNKHERAFADGWQDYASDQKYGTSLSTHEEN